MGSQSPTLRERILNKNSRSYKSIKASLDKGDTKEAGDLASGIALARYGPEKLKAYFAVSLRSFDKLKSMTEEDKQNLQNKFLFKASPENIVILKEIGKAEDDYNVEFTPDERMVIEKSIMKSIKSVLGGGK